MRHKLYRVVRRFGATVAVLFMAACGTTRTPSSNTTQLEPPNETAASGPVLDAWWDPVAGGLRIVNGVAGAASQAKPIFNDGTYSGAAVCMRQKIALLTRSSGALFLTSLPHGTPVTVAGEGIADAQLVFSPRCETALEYAPGKPGALLLQGLLSTPRASAISLPAGTTNAAVADSGSILVNVPQADGSAAIELVVSGSSMSRSVTVVSKFGGMSFLPGSDSALVADRAASTVLEAAQMSGNLSLTQVAGPADGVAQPVSVAASSDGHSAAVVNQKGSSIIRLDLTGRFPPASAACHCSPTELQPMAGNLAFRLNEAGTGTVWAFDGDAINPRIVFLPAEQSASAARGVQP